MLSKKAESKACFLSCAINTSCLHRKSGDNPGVIYTEPKQAKEPSKPISLQSLNQGAMALFLKDPLSYVSVHFQIEPVTD